MARLNKEREARLQPKRIKNAIEEIKRRGLELISQDTTKVKFRYKGDVITFFPYSGWHTGKGIKDGRGFKNLFNQLENHE